MRLRKPCQHGKYDGHPVEIGRFSYPDCPGGEFLDENAIVIEKDADEAWPEWALRAVRRPDSNTWVYEGFDLLDALAGAAFAFRSGDCPANHWGPGLGPCICRGSKHLAADQVGEPG